MAKIFTIEEHKSYAKSFAIFGPLMLMVDNDDVDQSAVTLLSERLVEILNEHWSPVYAWRCEGEDCEHAYQWQSDLRLVSGAGACACGGLLVKREVSAS